MGYRTRRQRYGSRTTSRAPDPGVSPASLIDAICALSAADGLEAEFKALVTALATTQGWIFHHETDSRKTRSGFPDLVLVRDRLLIRELKRNNRLLEPEQLAWLTSLRRAGVDAGVWRPEDWRSIEKELS